MPSITFDPIAREWIIGDRRIPIIAGGSTMITDEITNRRTDDDDIQVDDPDNPDPDDDDRDRDDDDDKDRDDDWNPPDKVQWERMRSALKNERRERKKVQREYEEKVNNLTSSASATNEIEVEKARIDERTKRDAYWSEEIVRAKAEAEFAAQGASAEMAGRLALLVNLKKVEWDEREREWDGLQDEVDDIIEGNQEFFKTKSRDDDSGSGSGRRQPQGRPRVDGAGRGGQGGGAPRKKPSTAQLLANQALGKGSRRR